jgi:hypothetical protein
VINFERGGIMRKSVVLLIVLGFMAGGVSVWSHHSLSATYDERIDVTLEGRIVQFHQRNPHSYLQLEAPDENGEPERWSLEWRGAGGLSRDGITRETLRVGDEVVVTIHPSRTVDDTRGVLNTLHRKSDGFGWGTRPGQVVD